MQSNKKSLVFKALGVAFSTLPPLFAVLSYFPLWKDRGSEVMLSGLCLFMLLISLIPLIRAVKAALKSPSAPFIWFLIFLVFFSLSKIAEDVTVISFIGFISNLIGAFFFSLARRFEVGGQ